MDICSWLMDIRSWLMAHALLTAHRSYDSNPRQQAGACKRGHRAFHGATGKPISNQQAQK
jgi:hypothetical protein